MNFCNIVYCNTLFNQITNDELFCSSTKDSTNDITLSGGDSLYSQNKKETSKLVNRVKTEVKDKDIWFYTGYSCGSIKNKFDLSNIDVLVDYEF